MLRHLFSKRAAPSLPAGCRLYAIGDIHGRLDLLVELLTLIQHDNVARAPLPVVIVLLGDLIDRGPNSAGVVRHAMLKPEWADQFIVLMGNHEEAMVEALGGNLEMARVWLRVGGRAALMSWGVEDSLLEEGSTTEIITKAREMIPDSERAWVTRLRSSYRIGDYYFVHAGVRPGVSLAQQNASDQAWIREEFLDSRAYHGAMIVHGHSISPDVEELDNRIGIDTGAYFTGNLTALCLEADQRWVLQTLPQKDE